MSKCGCILCFTRSNQAATLGRPRMDASWRAVTGCISSQATITSAIVTSSAPPMYAPPSQPARNLFSSLSIARSRTAWWWRRRSRSTGTLLIFGSSTWRWRQTKWYWNLGSTQDYRTFWMNNIAEITRNIAAKLSSLNLKYTLSLCR